MSLSALVIGTYLAVLLVLAAYGFHRTALISMYYRNRHRRPRPAGRFSELPVVTVQLPLYNEMYVVERLLDAVAGIRYPRDRFQIQVLDDSTDETQEICKRKIADLRARFPSWTSNTSTALTAPASRRARCTTGSRPPRANSS
jgi:cellulose synthase/poly-beta-1,6-N-acetylglucosamine synthase-like glycosyltransferase